MTDSTLLMPQTTVQQPAAPSTFDTVKAQMAANIPVSHLNQLLYAYQTNAMAPEDAAQFENAVHTGLIALPSNIHIGGKPAPANDNPQFEIPKTAIDAYNKAAVNPYDKGAMDYNSRVELDKELANGFLKLPKGTALKDRKSVV